MCLKCPGVEDNVSSEYWEKTRETWVADPESSRGERHREEYRFSRLGENPVAGKPGVSRHAAILAAPEPMKIVPAKLVTATAPLNFQSSSVFRGQPSVPSEA